MNAYLFIGIGIIMGWVMMRRTLYVFVVVLLAVILSACSEESSSKIYSDVPTTVEDNIDTSTEDGLAVEEKYTGNGSAWGSALFVNSSKIYSNKIALVAAEMSKMAEDETGEGIKRIYSDYGIYACEIFNYGGSAAFAIGQDTLYIDGKDTTILVITARGTKKWQEGVGDWLKGWTFDKVHKFLGRSVWDNVYDFEEEIWKGIEKYIDKYPTIQTTENIKILVTGHSLGGAAANMVGARLTNALKEGHLWNSDATIDDIYVYTFGAIKVLTTDTSASSGYENIHNIYNYYDSYGPNGNQKSYNVSSIQAKFGHTELYYLKYDENGENFWDSCNCHLMTNYIDALERQEGDDSFIKLACVSDEDHLDDDGGDNNDELENQDFLDTEEFIEGSWKSIGNEGFGQAQPGAIVAFDGTHCNFFSPYDTYAIYKEKGKWKLDCTSFMFSETLSFEVKIINENEIKIYYGSTCTTLEREAVHHAVQSANQQSTTYNSTTNLNSANGFVLPNSDKSYISKADLDKLSKWEVRVARNEIMARHGRRFNDQQLQDYFNGCDWYHGTMSAQDFDKSYEGILNEYEKKNAKLITEYEKEKGYN